MNYGAEPADQVVRYSLEGTEVALRLSGSAAITFAKFVAAILKDEKKVHGKTRLVRLLREGKPLKFFSVEKERMREFAHEAKMHGLLFVPMRDKTDPDHIEIAILADDASKVNRIFDRLQLDVVDTGMAEAVDEVAQDMEVVARSAPFWPPARSIPPCPDRPSVSTATVRSAAKSFPFVFICGIAICACM